MILRTWGLCLASLFFGFAFATTESPRDLARDPTIVRFATFNIWELRTPKLAAMDATGRGLDPQLQGAAEIIQRVRPDVLLINEIDFDADERLNATRFIRRYLNVPQRGQAPIDYPFQFFEPVNSGVPTGKDLDNDGDSSGPADALGYGHYPGQYGMVLLSRYPLDGRGARTFRSLAWLAMPGNLIPDGSKGRPEWYTRDEVEALPLSTKSHWDVPLTIGCQTIHVLCGHPTPPAYDGPEDHNGRRNFDEIRFWVDYLEGGATAGYIVDDAGRRAPLAADAEFVLLGDLNADPLLSSSDYGPHSIVSLLGHERVQDPAPSSRGALGDRAPGAPDHLERRTHEVARIDYVLPSRSLDLVGSGVFWPPANDSLHRLVAETGSSSNHRLVWTDLRLDCPPHLVDDVPTWAVESRGIVHAVVEIPSGTREKWEVDPETGSLEHEIRDGRPRIVDYSLPYPASYGMIPQTYHSARLGGDGDPLDLVILGPPIERGRVVPVRPLGLLQMIDAGERDDKIVAVQLDDLRLGHLETLEGLRREFPGTLEILGTWFTHYKRKPGLIRIAGTGSAQDARRLIASLHAEYMDRTGDREVAETTVPEDESAARGPHRIRLTLPPRMLIGGTLTLRADLLDESGEIDWRQWHALGSVSAVRVSDGSNVPLVTTVFETLPEGEGGGLPPANGIHFYNGVGSVSLVLGKGLQESVGPVEIVVRVDGATARAMVTLLDPAAAGQFRELEGTLAGDDLTWSSEDGVIRLTGTVVVPADRTLTIRPGTLVMADAGPDGEGTAVVVHGKVDARGTSAEPIYFFPSTGPAAMTLDPVALNNPSSWRGLWHQGDRKSTYSHVIVVGAGNGPTEFHPRPPVIRLAGGHSIRMTDCVLSDSPGKMLQGGGNGTYEFSGCLVSRVGIGGEFFGEGHRLLIEDSWFTRIGRAPRSNQTDGDMLHLGNADSEQTIRGCVFTDGGDDAIDHSDAHPWIENSIIYDLADKAVSLTNGSIDVRNVLVFRTKSGIRGRARIADSTILVESPVDCPESVQRSIIWPRTISTCAGEVSHTLVGLECALGPGEGNVFGDPLFADALGYDFELQPDSPALHAGPDGGPIGWRGFR